MAVNLDIKLKRVDKVYHDGVNWKKIVLQFINKILLG